VLASNSIAELSDLDILSQFRRLEHVVLVDNPVAKKEVGFGVGCGSRGRDEEDILTGVV